MPPRTEALLQAYTRELSLLRKMGAQFAQRYPKIAARLQLDGNGSADPHVERLIESFAFLAARVQSNIDNDLPEITTAVLGQLYPHFVEPIPPLSVARLVSDPAQGLPLGGYTVPRHTAMYADALSGDTCRFRTCYPVTLWPFEVTEVRVESPRKYDFLDRYREAAALIRIRLEIRGNEGSFKALDLSTLRVFLGGDLPSSFGIYDMLMTNLMRVGIVADKATTTAVAMHDATAVRPVGYGPDEELFPRPPTAHPGYGLLQEYFSFPEKFLFFDIDLGKVNVKKCHRTMDILLLLNATPPDRVSIANDSFMLGCTPIANLFPKIAEPIRLDERSTEYMLVGDRRLDRTTRIHSIRMVSSTSDEALRSGVMEPLFSYRHELGENDENKAYWWAQRRRAYRDGGVPDSDIHLSFLDLSFNPKRPVNETIFVHTLCTNRDLAPQIPPGTPLQMEEAAPVKNMSVLRRPTYPQETPIGGDSLWQLVSLLSLNQVALTTKSIGLEALREILRLHDFTATGAGENQLRGLMAMNTREVLRQVGSDAWRGFCRGIEATVTVDETMYVGASAILLSSVVSHFLGLYTSVNSFTQLVVKSSRRQGVWKQWPPMAGAQPIL